MAKVAVRPSTIHGLGVFAAENLPNHSLILVIDDYRVVDEAHPLQRALGEMECHCDYLAHGQVVLMQPPERHINHSCDPNCFVRTEAGLRKVFAFRDITAGEEITYDYAINNYGDFEWCCGCKVSNCRGTHNLNFFSLPPEIQLRYLPLLDLWFTEQFSKEISKLSRNMEREAKNPTINKGSFNIRAIIDADRESVRRLLTERWDSPLITSRGKLLDGAALPGFIAEKPENSIVGLLTFNVETNQCEIVSVDSFEQGIGVGTALFQAARNCAVGCGLSRLWVVTTNDNLAALKFYQRRGMRLVKLYPSAINHARATLKPQIPEIGEHGIPIRDEIELELLL